MNLCGILLLYLLVYDSICPQIYFPLIVHLEFVTFPCQLFHLCNIYIMKLKAYHLNYFITILDQMLNNRLSN